MLELGNTENNLTKGKLPLRELLREWDLDFNLECLFCVVKNTEDPKHTSIFF